MAKEKISLEDKWVNVEYIAEYLSITEDTARTWTREGMLPAYKVGKRYKYKLSEIDDWVRTGKIRSSEE
jgi:excisionase family DNA binding protein